MKSNNTVRHWITRLAFAPLSLAILVSACGQKQTTSTPTTSKPCGESEVASTSGGAVSKKPKSYPPGADTVAYWGNGRFSVILNNFFDEEASADPCIFRGITRFRSDGDHVFCQGGDGYLIVDLKAKTTKICSALKDVPPEYEADFKRLAETRPDNTVMDPKTLKPVK